MSGEGRSGAPGSEGSLSREERIARVLALCADRLNAGEELSLDQLLATHADLSPELGQALGALHQIGPPSREVPPLETLGDYHILREVGHGGMGVVYEAHHKATNRRVALKVLSGGLLANPRAVARFRREARVLSRLNHPGICMVYETGMADGTPFIAMRFLEAETLAMRIGRARGIEAAISAADPTTDPALERSFAREVPPTRPGGMGPSGPPTKKEILGFVEVIEKVARALHVAHEAGLVHRDIKPSNLMVTPEGDPVILDFGLARDVKGDSALTQSGELMGTPTYMSPEHIAGRPLDRRTDVYSLGVTLYECLTLQVPFDAPTREVLYQRILGSDPPAPRRLNPRISKDLKVVLETALEKNVDRRYQTALDFAEDLRRVRAFEPIRARPAGPLLRFNRWAKRNPRLAAALAVLVFTLAGVLFLTSELYEQNVVREEALSLHRMEVRGELDDLWTDPSKLSVKISSERRALLQGAPWRFRGTPPPSMRLTFGVYTHVMPTQMLDGMSLILDYLERDMGVPINFAIYQDYKDGLRALLQGQADFMRVGPASYVLAKEQDPRVIPLAMQRHERFVGVIFTRRESDIHEVKDLTGKPFAFGDPHSTIGNYGVKAYLHDRGIFSSHLPGSSTHRNHVEVVRAVREGRFPAGAAKESAVMKDPGLRTIATFENVGMPWVARVDLDPAIVQRLQRGLLSLKDPETLKPIEDAVVGFQEAKDEDFNPVRDDMKKAAQFDAR